MKVYHFHNGSGGGVLSVIRNLLKYTQHPGIENHVIYTINNLENPRYTIPHLQGAVSEKIFYYSPKWNFYYTCRRLAKLVPQDALIIAHDWLELGMVSNLGLPNKVVAFIHGDYEYYYKLAGLHRGCINLYIAISESIAEKLKGKYPDVASKVVYLRFPVPEVRSSGVKVNESIIFIGRKSIEKGIHLLPQIDAILVKAGVYLEWHIAGGGDYNEESFNIWSQSERVNVYGEVENAKLISMLSSINFYILPSLAEGMPVSLIESMKAGLIPLVNDISGGIQELIIQGITGYKISGNNPEEYAACILQAYKDRSLSGTIRANAIRVANGLFEPFINTRLIEEAFLNVHLSCDFKKVASKVYGSRLDHPLIPNFLTSAFRSIK